MTDHRPIGQRIAAADRRVRTYLGGPGLAAIAAAVLLFAVVLPLAVRATSVPAVVLILCPVVLVVIGVNRVRRR
ncbi:hypothetical protein SAMN05444374_103197 [Rhodococcoides kroppenstedtii]|uniref:Uncharacterized protein n=1 Tax=Rhodococcoides kroppenstedtii TaxID=293050 RepID=A0A1I0SZU8_9NOCA|nr:hypothetical protein [Rhodococcus kroppenstedtii]SFA45044.1 hypothetical protein SAMN05444374_103197 [Rhodococcus kroppenstedtii]